MTKIVLVECWREIYYVKIDNEKPLKGLMLIEMPQDVIDFRRKLRNYSCCVSSKSN